MTDTTERAWGIFAVKAFIFGLLLWMFQVVLVSFLVDYMLARMGYLAFNPYGGNRSFASFVSWIATLFFIITLISFKITNKLADLKDEERIFGAFKDKQDRATGMFLVLICAVVLMHIVTHMISNYIWLID